jgi:hypothetical protein
VELSFPAVIWQSYLETDRNVSIQGQVRSNAYLNGSEIVSVIGDVGCQGRGSDCYEQLWEQWPGDYDIEPVTLEYGKPFELRIQTSVSARAAVPESGAVLPYFAAVLMLIAWRGRRMSSLASIWLR